MLTDSLFSQPGHLIRRAHQIATAVFMEEARASELTPVQFSSLVVIADHPGIDATRLAELVSFDRATIGNVVERMEQKGLVRRETGTRDRRTKRLTITPKGRAIIRKVEPMAPQIGGRILERLDEGERGDLLRLLGKLVAIEQVVTAAAEADSAQEEAHGKD